ncbi:chromosome condensation (RCC1) repeat [Rhizoctonia solani]|uniref:Chromosome condensation (RCC1) repeat n=1 Tax=Rhizoctonia solani TaxID=456999 RepID=A0A8H7IAE7_9AGAM|nr:chromosome condensation (RCC1) repeat [Rhizoctonia solani]
MLADSWLRLTWKINTILVRANSYLFLIQAISQLALLAYWTLHAALITHSCFSNASPALSFGAAEIRVNDSYSPSDQLWYSSTSRSIPRATISNGYEITGIAACWETSFVILTPPAVTQSAELEHSTPKSDVVVSFDFRNVAIPGIVSARVRDIATGPHHVTTLLEDENKPISAVVGWGAYRHGQLGTGALTLATPAPNPKTKRPSRPGPVQMVDKPLIILNHQDRPVRLAAGSQHTLILHESGKITKLGSSRRGQLDIPEREFKGAYMGCTWTASFVVSEDGQVEACGSSNHGQLGRGDNASAEFAPVPLPGSVELLACGSEHILAVIGEEVWAWAPMRVWPPADGTFEEKVVAIWAGHSGDFLAVKYDSIGILGFDQQKVHLIHPAQRVIDIVAFQHVGLEATVAPKSTRKQGNYEPYGISRVIHAEGRPKPDGETQSLDLTSVWPEWKARDNACALVWLKMDSSSLTLIPKDVIQALEGVSELIKDNMFEEDQRICSSRTEEHSRRGAKVRAEHEEEQVLQGAKPSIQAQIVDIIGRITFQHVGLGLPDHPIITITAEMKWLPLFTALVYCALGIRAEGGPAAAALDGEIKEANVTTIWSDWKDGDKRAWLAANGILSPDVQLEEEETGSDGLNKLMENYFFEEDQTVYSTWSEEELQMWLISRRFVPRDEARSLGHEQLPWVDTAEAREWLQQNGHAEEAEAATDKDIFEVMMKYFKKGSDATAEFMVWPDSRLRAFLRARGVKEPKVGKRQRPDLVHMVRVRSKQKPTTTEDLVKQLKNVLDSGADWSEEQLVSALAILGGNKHRGPGKALREASRFQRTADNLKKNTEEEKMRQHTEETSCSVIDIYPGQYNNYSRTECAPNSARPSRPKATMSVNQHSPATHIF